MSTPRELISWPAAFIASLATHLAVLSLAALSVHSSDGANHRPHIDQPKLRSGSPLAVALVPGREATEQAQPGQFAVQAVRRIGRGRGRAHTAVPGFTPPAANDEPGREPAVPSRSNLSLGDTSFIEETSEEPGPGGKNDSLSGSGEISSGQSATGEQGASGRVATTPERITELHQRLATSARRCYPPTARRLRLHGEVGLHFCLNSDGFAQSQALRGSTGSALLDRASLECVLAGALPAPGMVGCYDVQVRFSDER
jgi:TonB family protein